MTDFDLERKNDRVLYRELFFKANEDFKKQISRLKTNNYCHKCNNCCEIRYSNLSPTEIFELSQKEDQISSEFIKIFLPYGVEENFDYELLNTIDINKNHNLAQKINLDYVNAIISKVQEPVYFYFCKYHEENSSCMQVKNKNIHCSNFPSSVTTILPKVCGYRNWQEDALKKIRDEISREILIKIQEIKESRFSYDCKRTGSCCKFASSEFSYEELKEKAKNGDNFATQFTSVFIPYDNIEEIKEAFPEYIDLYSEYLNSEEKVYFYHCPHITDENLCSIYEFRPQICKDFPDNPLALLPPNCGYKAWKDDVHVASMLLHALIEILEFNMKKIELALE
jgi:Fe-S-cluster containining protein